MGAAQLLQSLPKESRFCAIVVESPCATFREVAYARFGREFHAGPWLGRTVFRPTVDVGFLTVRLMHGLDMEQASPASAVASTKTPVLLIHGLKDRNIPPYHADWIQSMNASAIVVWKVPGATHTMAHQTAPAEFEQRVLKWFERYTLQKTTSANSIVNVDEKHPPECQSPGAEQADLYKSSIL